MESGLNIPLLLVMLCNLEVLIMHFILKKNGYSTNYWLSGGLTYPFDLFGLARKTNGKLTRTFYYFLVFVYPITVILFLSKMIPLMNQMSI